MLFACLLLVGAGNTMLVAAVMPPLTRELGLPDWTAGAIFSLSALAWTVMSPVWGRKSSEWGRRPVAVIGMVGFAVSMGLFGWIAAEARSSDVNNWAIVFVLLLVSRGLFGLFGSGTSPAAQAYIADRTSPAERTDAIASVSAGFSLGTVVGPAAAAVLIVWFGLLAPVFAVAIAAAFAALFLWRSLPENLAPADRQVSRAATKGLWRSSGLAPYLIYAVGLSLATGVLTQTYPFAMMDRMELTGPEAAQYIGPAMAVGAMATLTAQLAFIPRLKLPVRDLMSLGAALLTLGTLIMIGSSQFALFIIVQILLGLGLGFSRPGFMSGASLAAGPELQGNVAGLITAANGAGYVVSPLFGLWMYQAVHPVAPFAFCAALLSALGLYAWRRASATAPPTVSEDDPAV